MGFPSIAVSMAGKSAGGTGELRSSLRIYRATKGLDANITLRSRTRKAEMKAGGSFNMLSLLRLLDLHGPELQFEGSGPDAEHALSCIVAALDGKTTKEFAPEDRRILEGHGPYQRKILADLPPLASARWLAWLREDRSRTLPWPDEVLPAEHGNRHPYTQAAGGLSIAEIYRKLSALPTAEYVKVKGMNTVDLEEYLCAPQDVRRKMLAAINDAT